MEMLFLGGLGLPELIAIIVLVLLLFGAKKVPDLMKGLGKGVRSFKEGMKGLDSDAPSQNSSSGTSQSVHSPQSDQSSPVAYSSQQGQSSKGSQDFQESQSAQSVASQSDPKSGSAEDGH